MPFNLQPFCIYLSHFIINFFFHNQEFAFIVSMLLLYSNLQSTSFNCLFSVFWNKGSDFSIAPSQILFLVFDAILFWIGFKRFTFSLWAFSSVRDSLTDKFWLGDFVVENFLIYFQSLLVKMLILLFRKTIAFFLSMLCLLRYLSLFLSGV